MLAKLGNWYRSTFGQALVGGGLLWAALPPLGVWVLPWGPAVRLGLPPLGPCLLAWIAPIWWVLLIRRQELPGRRPYAALWLVGFVFWMAALHWLRLPHWATSFGWVALAFYLGFYLPVFVALSRVAVRRLQIPVILAAPAVWTGLELARGHLLTGFTMASLGHTQYHWIELIQLSDLAGAYGVDFVVMFAAACLASIVPCEDKKLSCWPLVPLVVLLAAVICYGRMRISHPPAQAVARIALIQGSVDIELKIDPNKASLIQEHYRRLSRQAVQKYGSLDAIVWPETMFREPLVTYDENAAVPDQWEYSEAAFKWALQQAAYRSRLGMAKMATDFSTPMLLGVDTHHFGAGGMKRLNSAVLVDRSGAVKGRYDKMHRVLFGEYVPFAEYFPWLENLTPLPSTISAGEGPTAFELDGLRIAPNICYESVLSHVIRRQVNVLAREGREPDVLVNLTNDGWFWGSSELDMHLVCGVFRAVECRKPFLIAANTGFSAWIDADGRIRAQGPRRAADTLLAQVGRDQRASWYLKHGDWPAGFCLAACVVFAGVGLWDRRRSRGSK